MKCICAVPEMLVCLFQCKRPLHQGQNDQVSTIVQTQNILKWKIKLPLLEVGFEPTHGYPYQNLSLAP